MRETMKTTVFFAVLLAVLALFSVAGSMKQIKAAFPIMDCSSYSDAPAATSTVTHMFGVIQERLYQAAISPPEKTVRSRFTLDGWKRGSGGLDDEDRTLLGELYYDASAVFEYGLGESTLIAAHVGVPRYAGVDSDAVWVARARKKSKMDHFRFTFADIGETEAWGHPTNPKLQKIWYDYQIAPLVAEKEPFDIYLVDGRYRVACFCVAVLHAMQSGGNMSEIMFATHDNDAPARGYGEAVGRVADVVHSSKKLFVYKIKHNITEEDVFRVWEEKVDDRTRRRF